MLDGDVNRGRIKNVVILPGQDGPDALIYKTLKGLAPDNPFWKLKDGYNKQFCFKDLMTLDLTTDDTRQRNKVKNWYKA